ncbi:MAG: rhodanese-like domain-containing protein [Planctomycetota bacterium]
MFIHRIKTPGLAQNSYVVGSGTVAAVIDPRRDIEVYIDIARQQGVAITGIFETHRNEDLISGGPDLARRTGAVVHHGAQLDFAYGEPAHEDDSFVFGDCRLRVLETPGHTPESLSFVLDDTATGADAVAVFTGDCLFVNSVGRTDLHPAGAQTAAEQLYASIHDKLLPLGDQTMVHPAHGSGSVCGGGLAKRDVSTIGIERQHNPLLALDQDAFIAAKCDEHPLHPPYFQLMEQYNKDGAPPLPHLPLPRPVGPATFAEQRDRGMQAVDLRGPEAAAGAVVPGALCIPVSLITAYAGFLLDPARPIGLIGAEVDDGGIAAAIASFSRIGFDQLDYELSGGMTSWETAGHDYTRLPSCHISELIDADTAERLVVDVRPHDEWQGGHLPQACHIFLGELPQRLDELPRDRELVTFCGSGHRAIIAASILASAGFDRVTCCLGSMAACKARGCELVGA